jgi:hypothetical protein
MPKVGAFNVVYFLEFSDGVRWVARIPIVPWSEALRKRMSLDRISLDFIGAKYVLSLSASTTQMITDPTTAQPYPSRKS